MTTTLQLLTRKWHKIELYLQWPTNRKSTELGRSYSPPKLARFFEPQCIFKCSNIQHTILTTAKVVNS